MSITMQEFRVTMETIGVNRLEDCWRPGYSTPVPCFEVNGTIFYHSATFYICCKGKKVPSEILCKAMAEFGETDPGDKNFWYGEIHTIKGMVTLVTMLTGNYTKEYVEELTNKIYKKLLDCKSLKTNKDFAFPKTDSPKMKELYKLLIEFSNSVNPYGNSKLKLKDPIEYLDYITINFAYQKTPKFYSRLKLATPKNVYCLKYNRDEYGWYYDAFLELHRNRKKGYINLGYYDTVESDETPSDSVIRLRYKAIEDRYDDQPDDVDLRISVKTGLAWKTNKEDMAKLVTDEQLDVMIMYMKLCIKKIKNKVLRKMI